MRRRDPRRLAESGRTVSRRRFESGSTFEKEFAYSRAVADGEWVFVSGTTGFDYGSMTLPEGVVAQAEQCFRNVRAALDAFGATLEDVVRVTYVLPDAQEFAQCAPVLRKYLDGVRPAATMIQAGLIDPRLRIEIEVTARRRS